MNRLEELLAKLQDQTASPDELAELKHLLATPEGRAQARDFLQMESALHSAFQVGTVLEALVKKQPDHPAAKMGLFSALVEIKAPHFQFARPRLALAAAIALLCSLAGVWFWHIATAESEVSTAPEGKVPASIARLAAFGGEVQIARRGRQMPAKLSLSLVSGDEIRTAGAASARIEYAGEATWVELAENSALELGEIAGGKRLTLRQGRFKADVAPQPTGQPMVCRTPQADALVLGTVFTLAAWSDQTFLNVERGMVRLSQTDGSAEDVKAGEAARATLGQPVTNVPNLGESPQAIKRVPQRWILDKGLLTLPQLGSLSFNFDTKPNWTFVKGAFWRPPTPSMSGHLVLTGAGSGNYGYKVVTPYISVGSNEVIRVTGHAKYFNGARLRVAYYLSDSSPKCFGHLHIKGHTESDSPAFVPFQFECTLPDYADLSYIALILYCNHGDGTDPKEGDTILIDELHISRGR